MATADLSRVSTLFINYSRLCKLLIDGGTRVLREVFDKIHPPTSLRRHLLDPANHKILKTLKYKKVLYKEQWDKLYPAGGSTVTSSSFDITLLCLLLRNICHLKTPSAGWNKPPLPTSTNTEDDVVRIKLFRNNLYGHIKEAAISDSDFTKYWKDIKRVLVRLGGQSYKAEIEELLVVSTDPEDGKYAIQCLEEWVKNEEKIMKALHEEAEKTRHELAGKMDEVGQHVVAEIKGHMMPHASKKRKLTDIGLSSKRLKSSTNKHTECQPKLMAIHSVSRARTDEIFTNLTIQRGRKGVRKRNKASRTEHLDNYSQPRGTPIKTCQEIFNRPGKDTPKPKSILVVGKPGIGKSLFCQKLVRDWANDILLQNEFDFVYLLPFRQLNQLEKRTNELNFCEVLNRSPLLDQSSSIDESLFKYMNEHQEKVLFILDGYDEYANWKNINSFEEEYENNPEICMPVSALVSKIMQKKIFSDATVMVTSRPREAKELGGIDFDATVEILGFSPKQVEEFIVKYFQSIKHDEFTNVVSKHIMKNPDLLSVAHIPMMCFLICWCLDWNIESKKEKNLPVNRITEDLPVTMTDLYSEVVRIFEIKHHSKSEYKTKEIPHQFEIPQDVENTLHKLSKLAAQTMIEEEFIFQESDLKKFGITSKEVELLTASGLLTCGPGLRETPFAITQDICFSHLTFHEYFAALEFVCNDDIIPSEIESHMVLQFMAGVMAKGKYEELMEEFVTTTFNDECILLSARCLYEYQDKAFGVRMIKKHYRQFCNDDGKISCGEDPLSEVESVAVSFFLNLISEFCNKENAGAQKQSALSPQSFIITCFDCVIDTLEGAKRICHSLKRKSCPITSLTWHTKDAKCYECLGQALPSTNITTLHILGKCDDNVGMQYLIQALPSTKITSLDLGGTEITDVGIQYVSQALPLTKITSLDLCCTQITDVGLQYLGQALSFTKITNLDISSNKTITDVGLQYLGQALPSTNIAMLYLGFCINITDVGLQYFSQVLPSTKITSLDLRGTKIADVELQYLSQALPSTKITSLDLSNTEITDEGLQYLSQSLPSTKITSLDLSNTEITDEGLQYLSQALPSTKIIT